MSNYGDDFDGYDSDTYHDDLYEWETEQVFQDHEGDEDYWDDGDDDRSEFADPHGNSALRAATPGNPRIHPCPTCGVPNRLTAKDVALGYQCNACADRAEGHGD